MEKLKDALKPFGYHVQKHKTKLVITGNGVNVYCYPSKKHVRCAVDLYYSTKVDGQKVDYLIPKMTLFNNGLHYYYTLIDGKYLAIPKAAMHDKVRVLYEVQECPADLLTKLPVTFFHWS